MASPLWFVNFLKKIYPNVKQFAKLSKLPLAGRVIEHFLFKDDDIIIVTKNSVVIDINQNITKEKDVVLPSKLIEHFIEQASFHWLMDFCICREGNDCKSYPQELGCLFLGEAVLDINPKLGRRVNKKEALKHIQKCADAGLIHLIGKNKLDTVWLNVGPGNKLMTICSCCNCCCLWRALPNMSDTIKEKINKMDGVSVQVDSDTCKGCGNCTKDVCFVEAISVQNKKAVINNICKACGRCIEVCPNDSIKLTIDDSVYINNSISRLSQKIDLN